uniref:Uncharacterized protein n=1 Tax=Poecilia latipinna TaxID=48699 RepID=A0A3B3V6D5_9TELE
MAFRDKRDVQTSKRHGSYKSVLSAGSAMAMEIKRKKIRENAFFLQKEVSLKRQRHGFVMYVVRV